MSPPHDDNRLVKKLTELRGNSFIFDLYKIVPTVGVLVLRNSLRSKWESVAMFSVLSELVGLMGLSEVRPYWMVNASCFFASGWIVSISGVSTVIIAIRRSTGNHCVFGKENMNYE